MKSAPYYYFSLALVASLAFSVASYPKPVHAEQRSVLIEVYDDQGVRLGKCSGVALSSRATATAAHCFSAQSKRVAIDGRFVTLEETIWDDYDHVLLVHERIHKTWSRLGPAPARSTPICIEGNPGVLERIRRCGQVAGRDSFQGDPYLLLDVVSHPGDSGAPVFDKRGRVVAMVTYVFSMSQKRSYIALAGASPLDFTAEELRRAGVR